MQDQAVCSREQRREMGRKAALSGKLRGSHQMNWHAVGLPDWLEGYDEVRAWIGHHPSAHELGRSERMPC